LQDLSYKIPADRNRGSPNHAMTLMTATQIRFSRKPAFAIWGIDIFPVPKTMALGGVATGSGAVGGGGGGAVSTGAGAGAGGGVLGVSVPRRLT